MKNCVFVKLVFLMIFISVGFASCKDMAPPQHNDFKDAETYFRGSDTSSVHFFVLSDWGFSGDFGQLDVEAEMTRMSKIVRLDFVLTAGDNFQIAGVQSATDSLWFSNFEDIYKDSALLVPWYPALGNHDHYGNAAAQVEYSQLNPRWRMVAPYYTFVQPIDSVTGIRFVVLDTQSLIDGYNGFSDVIIADSIAQYAWFKETLRLNTEKWVVVIGHHPVYSASTFHGDTPEMNVLVKPLLNKYNVDFYICGHDHHFEHARDGNYTDYIVTGTGGYVRAIGSNEHTVYSLSSLGFTYISASREKMKLYFITSDGKMAYQLTKQKEVQIRRSLILSE